MIVRGFSSLLLVAFVAACGGNAVSSSSARGDGGASGTGGGGPTGQAGNGGGSGGGGEGGGEATGGVGGSGGGGLGIGGLGTGGTGGGVIDPTQVPPTCSDPPPLSVNEPPLDPPRFFPAEVVELGQDPSVAVGPDGDGIVTWISNGEIRARRYSADVWSDVEVLASPLTRFGTAPAVAMGPGGHAVIVYPENFTFQRSAICARVYEPAMGWSPPAVLGSASEGWWQEPTWPEPTVGMDAAGNAIAMWWTLGDPPFPIVARRYTPTTGWGAETEVRTDRSAAPRLLVRPNGAAVAAWAPLNPGSIETAEFDVAAGWQPGVGTGPNGRSIQLAATTDFTLVSWLRDESMIQLVEIAEKSNGSWSPPILLGSAETVTTPALATSGNGRAIAVWSDVDDLQCAYTPHVQVRSSTAQWVAETPMITTPRDSVVLSGVAGGESGHFVVTWQSGAGSRPLSCHPSGANVIWRAPSGAWLAQENLDNDSLARMAPPAMTPSGRALVAWSRRPAIDDVVLARWLDPP